MLNIAAVRPSSPSLFLEAFLSLFSSRSGPAHTHGCARYFKLGDRIVHDQTEISLQPHPKETPEAFMWRVWQEAEEGALIEPKLRNNQVVGATITRRSAIEVRPAPGESFEAFAARIKAYAKEMPRA
jgi:hypothetical protein